MSSPIIDTHVHIVGDGTSGSGCRIRVDRWHEPLARLMLKHIGLPQSALSGNLDKLYLDHLLQLIAESSIDRAVILANDFVHDSQGRKLEHLSSLYVPNDYVLKLASEHDELLAGVSIHPARLDSLDELERAIEGGAALMKMLPNCQNIDCNDPQFIRFWERMAKAKLPLLAHTGGEHSLPVLRPDLASPRMLELPLQCGVTVIAAHVGTASGVTDPDFFSLFVEMTKKYPRLYGDISALSLPIRSRVIRQCLEQPIVEKLVHGSDFPVPVYPFYCFMRKLYDKTSYKRLRSIKNPIERDYQIKKAVGFPDEVFTRVGGLLRTGN